MAISFQCDCGRKFRTADEHAGRGATCPDCGIQLTVPAADAAAQPLRQGPPPIPDLDPPAPNGYGYNVQSEEVVPSKRPDASAAPYGRDGRDDRNDDDYRRRPDQRRSGGYDERNPFVKKTPPASSGWTDKGVLAGLGMMLGGVVITVGGLAVGFIIYWGPILFIAGVICLIKGIATGKT